jgi:hypothetical protein
MFNTHVRDNFNAMGVAKAANTGDMFYAASPNQLATLPVGSAGMYLFGGDVPAWGNITSMFNSGDGVSFVQAVGIVGTPQTLISSGITVVTNIWGILVPDTGAARFVELALIDNGVPVEIYTGGADSVTLTSSSSVVSVVRAAGTKTYSIALCTAYT